MFKHTSGWQKIKNKLMLYKQALRGNTKQKAFVASVSVWFRSKKKTQERGFRFWPREKWNESQKMKEGGGGWEGRKEGRNETNKQTNKKCRESLLAGYVNCFRYLYVVTSHCLVIWAGKKSATILSYLLLRSIKQRIITLRIIYCHVRYKLKKKLRSYAEW